MCGSGPKNAKFAAREILDRNKENRRRAFSILGVMRVRLSLGDVVYVSDERDHGIIEQFIPYGKIIVRLIKKGTVLKLSRGDVKKSRHAE